MQVHCQELQLSRSCGRHASKELESASWRGQVETSPQSLVQSRPGSSARSDLSSAGICYSSKLSSATKTAGVACRAGSSDCHPAVGRHSCHSVPHETCTTSSAARQLPQSCRSSATGLAPHCCRQAKSSQGCEAQGAAVRQ